MATKGDAVTGEDGDGPYSCCTLPVSSLTFASFSSMRRSNSPSWSQLRRHSSAYLSVCRCSSASLSANLCPRSSFSACRRWNSSFVGRLSSTLLSSPSSESCSGSVHCSFAASSNVTVRNTPPTSASCIWLSDSTTWTLFESLPSSVSFPLTIWARSSPVALVGNPSSSATARS